MAVGLGEDPLFLKHDNGPGHPERPERLQAVTAAIRSLPYFADLVRLTPRDASRKELEQVHEPAYLDLIEQSRTRPLTIFDQDTRANEWSYAAAIRAAGLSVSAVHAALDGETRRSFVAARPPGHHAEAGRAMGFCLVNNAAVAAASAVADGGLNRVAVVDWDVHHGNGTSHIFSARQDVLYLSIHQSPHYPGTGSLREVGTHEGTGYTVNIPLPAGCRDVDYAAAMETIALPVLRNYQPQLIIVSAGFDPHRDDPLAGMQLTVAGFQMLTRQLTEIAEEFSGGRIVHLLEGGYDLDALAEGAGAVLSVLAGAAKAPSRGNSRPAEEGRPGKRASDAILSAWTQHSAFWTLPERGSINQRLFMENHL